MKVISNPRKNDINEGWSARIIGPLFYAPSGTVTVILYRRLDEAAPTADGNGVCAYDSREVSVLDHKPSDSLKSSRDLIAKAKPHQVIIAAILSNELHRRHVKSIRALNNLHHADKHMQGFVLGKDYSALLKKDVFASVLSTSPDPGALMQLETAQRELSSTGKSCSSRHRPG